MEITESQCGNVSIFLPLRFYVKSTFEILEAQKLPFLQFQGLRIFNLSEFQPSEKAKIQEKSKPLNVLKWQFSDL